MKQALKKFTTEEEIKIPDDSDATEEDLKD